MQFPWSTGYFKTDILVHFYTFYDHKNGFSFVNNGIRHMVQNQNLERRQMENMWHLMKTFSAKVNQKAKLGLT